LIKGKSWESPKYQNNMIYQRQILNRHSLGKYIQLINLKPILTIFKSWGGGKNICNHIFINNWNYEVNLMKFSGNIL